MRKFFSNLFAFAFVPIFALFLIAAPIKYFLLNPDFYKTAFDKSDFYESITAVIPPALEAITKGNFKGFGPLTVADISQILRESVKPEFLKPQIENALDQFFNFAYKKSPAIKIVVPLGDLKKTVADNFNQSLHSKLESLPVCTPEQLQEFQSQASGGVFNCKPEGIALGELEKAFSEGISGPEGLLTKLPDEYNATAALSKKPETLKQIQDFFSAFIIIFWILQIASALLLLLLALINLKYLPGMLKWVSIPAIVGSLPILVFGLAAKILTPAVAASFLTKLTPETKTLATSLISNFTASFASYFIIYSGITLAVAVVLLILGIILGKKFPKKIVVQAAISETPEDKAEAK